MDSPKKRPLVYRLGEKEESLINEVAGNEWEAVERSLGIHRASGSGNQVENNVNGLSCGLTGLMG
ncbi:hypothetical protein E2C01_074785 [Portunus trituberculatus]|uniref:Uncharacterized protein n=1 Tax=Portunus trituberculatus TaxID=210409 RepID=A0A5B7ID55_PORTR|nr:hypothetical protein [Portunus trituberculatus]